MRIGIVAEPYEESKASGMGYVVLELMKHLRAESPQDEFVFYSSKPISRELIPGDYTNVLIPRGFVKQFFWFLRLKDRLDVLLFMAPLLPFWIPKRIKSVLVFQEVGSQKVRPKDFKERIRTGVRDRILMPICMARASVVVAASNATKIDILKYYRVSSEKVPVIYDGYQELSRFKDSAPVGDEKMKPYFLFAGKIKYRKNVHGIVSAFIAFKKRTGAGGNLVLAGDYDAQGEYFQEMMRAVEEAGLTQRVFFVGYAEGPRMYSLYTNARAFTFPSINEGFGMPPIEAMSFGVPVITSNISSMAEVAGDAALLVDPFNVQEISDAMEKIFSDENLRAELISRGLKRVQAFSWPSAAKEFMHLLRSLTHETVA